MMRGADADTQSVSATLFDTSLSSISPCLQTNTKSGGQRDHDLCMKCLW